MIDYEKRSENKIKVNMPEGYGLTNELYYYITWTAEDDAMLTRIMESKLERRTTLEKLFVEAATRLNRTDKSVRNRWYKLQRDKEESGNDGREMDKNYGRHDG